MRDVSQPRFQRGQLHVKVDLVTNGPGFAGRTIDNSCVIARMGDSMKKSYEKPTLVRKGKLSAVVAASTSAPVII